MCRKHWRFQIWPINNHLLCFTSYLINFVKVLKLNLSTLCEILCRDAAYYCAIVSMLFKSLLLLSNRGPSKSEWLPMQYFVLFFLRRLKYIKRTSYLSFPLSHEYFHQNLRIESTKQIKNKVFTTRKKLKENVRKEAASKFGITKSILFPKTLFVLLIWAQKVLH